MSLGQKLVDNINKTAEEKLREKNEKLEKDSMEIRHKRNEFRNFFKDTLKKIESDIESGLVPKPIKMSYNNMGPLFTEISYSAAGVAMADKISKTLFADIYKDVVGKWEKENDLVLNFVDAHDGGGRESWYEISAQPAPSLAPQVKKLKR